MKSPPFLDPPRRTVHWRRLLHRAYQQQDWPRVVRFAHRELQEEFSSQATVLLSMALHNLGQTGDALRTVTKALEVQAGGHPAAQCPELWQHRAMLLLVLDQVEAALKAANRAIDLEPSLGAAYAVRLACWKRLGHERKFAFDLRVLKVLDSELAVAAAQELVDMEARPPTMWWFGDVHLLDVTDLYPLGPTGTWTEPWLPRKWPPNLSCSNS